MYTKLPAAGPSFLIHFLVVLAALLAWPILALLKKQSEDEDEA